MKNSNDSEALELLSLIDLKEDIYEDCWRPLDQPLELGVPDFKTISLYLETHFKHLEPNKEKILFCLRTLLNNTRFVDSHGTPLNNSLMLFLGFEIASMVQNLQAPEFLPRLKTVVAYPSFKIRKSAECEGGILFSKATSYFTKGSETKEIINGLQYLTHYLNFKLQADCEKLQAATTHISPKLEVDELKNISNKRRCQIKTKESKKLLVECKKILQGIEALKIWQDKLAEQKLDKVLQVGLGETIFEYIRGLLINENGALVTTPLEDQFISVLKKSLNSEDHKFAALYPNITPTEIYNNIIEYCILEAEYSLHLSIPQYIKEITNQEQKGNVLVHEMAHLIDYEFQCTQAQPEWQHMYDEYLKSKPYILGNYAATNIKEFFAVSCEVFFQNPEFLKKHLPKVYQALKEIYKQEPLSQRQILSDEDGEKFLEKVTRFSLKL